MSDKPTDTEPPILWALWDFQTQDYIRHGRNGNGDPVIWSGGDSNEPAFPSYGYTEGYRRVRLKPEIVP